MKPFVARPIDRLEGKVSLPGDKSIAHRSVIISSLSLGQTKIENFPTNDDCLSTLKALKELGVKITKKRLSRDSCTLIVEGRGLSGLQEAKGPIYVGESGTTLRLLLGVLAGQSFKAKLVAGPSLSKRPMLRVAKPLRMMGAKISASCRAKGARCEEYPPITITGSRLKPISYKMPVASAQVKSAILLAALYPSGKTCVREQIPTRDHTERMLRLFGSEIKVSHNTIVIKGGNSLISPKRIYVPGDISSASFFLTLSAITLNSKVCIKNIGLNPSRLGVIEILRRMGSDIKIKSKLTKINNSEPVGDIVIRGARLKGAIVKKQEIPSLIDELPILMVAACYAVGKTVFSGVEELRVKETDRIRSMTENLRKMGADIITSRSVTTSDKIIIMGKGGLEGAKVKSFGDHRSAMSMIVAGLRASGLTLIDDISCINKSFPDFLKVLNKLVPSQRTSRV